jgi:uncharacterized protein YihD (DUF1040 family)
MPERLSSSYNNSKSSVIETESTTATKDEGLEIQRKITLATEGFTTSKFCELVLRDRSRLSGENALTISEYIMALKREINPRLSTIKNTIQFLSELSKSVGIEKQFEDMTRDDVLLYLDSNRKSENDDPLHKWIGSYNAKRSVLFRFFK